jgi:hypothetical protein
MLFLLAGEVTMSSMRQYDSGCYLSVGDDTARYSSHSFRIGAAAAPRDESVSGGSGSLEEPSEVGQLPDYLSASSGDDVQHVMEQRCVPTRLFVKCSLTLRQS